MSFARWITREFCLLLYGVEDESRGNRRLGGLTPGAALPDLTEPGLADVPAMREHVLQMVALMPPYEPRRKLEVTETEVPGYHGAPDVKVRVYAPAARERALPGLIYLHGGAYVFGGLDTGDNAAAPIADRAGVIVVSVEYRLAPEHPYPAALDDCYAVLEWTARSAASGYGIDIGPLGVLGESAGGGLAAALALLTKDRGGPELTAQFLDAPTVDDRLLTHSMRNLPVTPAWRAADALRSWTYYLRGTAEPGGDAVPLYAAAARAEAADLEGLPPAWVSHVPGRSDARRGPGLCAVADPGGRAHRTAALRLVVPPGARAARHPHRRPDDHQPNRGDPPSAADQGLSPAYATRPSERRRVERNRVIDQGCDEAMERSNNQAVEYRAVE
jgi:acetyl esterase